jgi:hypothetical protein
MVEFKICDSCLREITKQAIQHCTYKNGKKQRYDFCNVDCLVEFMKRKKKYE